MNYNTLHVFYVFLDVELKSNTALNASKCDVYFINIEKSMEKHIWSPYIVINVALRPKQNLTKSSFFKISTSNLEHRS